MTTKLATDMKIGILMALNLLIIIECDSQVRKKEEKEVSNQINVQSDHLDGFWMDDLYLKKIEETKSVYANGDFQPAILGFQLRKENLKSDKPFLFGFTSHEGGIDIPICFNEKMRKFTFDEKEKNNTSMFNDQFELNLIEKDKLEMRFSKNDQKEFYRRVENIESEFRRILFEGEFNSIGSDTKVTFSRSGDLTGFDGMKFFEVVYDFGLNIQFDAIVIYKSIEEGNWSKGKVYKYEFNSNILVLYPIETDWENMNHKIGSEKLELLKID